MELLLVATLSYVRCFEDVLSADTMYQEMLMQDK
jgi:hypothetical protein